MHKTLSFHVMMLSCLKNQTELRKTKWFGEGDILKSSGRQDSFDLPTGTGGIDKLRCDSSKPR